VRCNGLVPICEDPRVDSLEPNTPLVFRKREVTSSRFPPAFQAL
jgi:hypothetical protein